MSQRTRLNYARPGHKAPPGYRIVGQDPPVQIPWVMLLLHGLFAFVMLLYIGLMFNADNWFARILLAVFIWLAVRRYCSACHEDKHAALEDQREDAIEYHRRRLKRFARAQNEDDPGNEQSRFPNRPGADDAQPR